MELWDFKKFWRKHPDAPRLRVLKVWGSPAGKVAFLSPEGELYIAHLKGTGRGGLCRPRLEIIKGEPWMVDHSGKEPLPPELKGVIDKFIK